MTRLDHMDLQERDTGAHAWAATLIGELLLEGIQLSPQALDIIPNGRMIHAVLSARDMPTQQVLIETYGLSRATGYRWHKTLREERARMQEARR